MSPKIRKRKVLAVAMVLSVVFGLISVLRYSKENQQSMIRGSASWTAKGRQLGSAWNGGKPGLPVEVESDLSGPIPPGVDQPMVVKITIDQECSNSEVQLRGIDGLIVVGQRRAVLGACRPGEQIDVSTVVRIPAGLAAFLAVDVALEEIDPETGVASRRTISKAISVIAEGAKAQPKSIGKAVPSGKGGFHDKDGEISVELGNSRNAP